MEVIRTDSTHPMFVKLVQQLDAELKEMDGNEHAFYHQFNGIDDLKHCILIVEKDGLACGAIKSHDDKTVEIKRMFVPKLYRRKGLAYQTLGALELWANELGNTRCVLETGKRQPAAISLYHKAGYKIIENYGQYVGVQNSVCFEKFI